LTGGGSAGGDSYFLDGVSVGISLSLKRLDFELGGVEGIIDAGVLEVSSETGPPFGNGRRKKTSNVPSTVETLSRRAGGTKESFDESYEGGGVEELEDGWDCTLSHSFLTV